MMGAPATSKGMRVVITREALSDEDEIIHFYNWKVQVLHRLPFAVGGPQEHWRDHIVSGDGAAAYDDADDLEQMLQEWNLLDGNLKVLPIVRGWEQ